MVPINNGHKVGGGEMLEACDLSLRNVGGRWNIHTQLMDVNALDSRRYRP